MNRARSFAIDITAAMLFGLALALALPQAHAEMIATDALERERVKGMLARPEVVQELEKRGIPADEARARVDAMSGAEVSQLAGRLDALPAGGATDRDTVLVVILIVILVLIFL